MIRHTPRGTPAYKLPFGVCSAFMTITDSYYYQQKMSSRRPGYLQTINLQTTHFSTVPPPPLPHPPTPSPHFFRDADCVFLSISFINILFKFCYFIAYTMMCHPPGTIDVKDESIGLPVNTLFFLNFRHAHCIFSLIIYGDK
jgi:hypothetical protein